MNKFAGFARDLRSGLASRKGSRQMKNDVYLVENNGANSAPELCERFRAVLGSCLGFGTPCASRQVSIIYQSAWSAR